MPHRQRLTLSYIPGPPAACRWKHPRPVQDFIYETITITTACTAMTGRLATRSAGPPGCIIALGPIEHNCLLMCIVFVAIMLNKVEQH